MHSQFYNLIKASVNHDDDHGPCVELSVEEGQEDTGHIYIYVRTESIAESLALLINNNLTGRLQLEET